MHAEAELSDNDSIQGMLIDRGYYVESREVEDAIARRVATQAKERARRVETPKYMFGLTLRCNLACDYCWQVIEHQDERQQTPLMTEQMVDAAFAYIDRELEASGRTTAFISLFGGEPIIDDPRQRELVRMVGDRAKARRMRLHFTTNGRALGSYVDEIKQYLPSIQITIDGAGTNGKFLAGGGVLPLRGERRPDLLRIRRSSVCVLRGHREPGKCSRQILAVCRDRSRPSRAISRPLRVFHARMHRMRALAFLRRRLPSPWLQEDRRIHASVL
jgi:Radical SAM superfamily/4Fe-4S single cluster domain